MLKESTPEIVKVNGNETAIHYISGAAIKKTMTERQANKTKKLKKTWQPLVQLLGNSKLEIAATHTNKELRNNHFLGTKGKIFQKHMTEQHMRKFKKKIA